MAVVLGQFIALDDGTMLTPPPAAKPLPPAPPPPALTAPSPPPPVAPAPPSPAPTPPAPQPPPLPVAPDAGPQALAVPGVIVQAGTPSLGGEQVIAPVPTVEAQAGGVTTIPPGAEVGGVPTPGNTGDDPAADIANANNPDLSDLPGWELLDPFGVQLFSTDSMPLKGEAALASIAQACSDYGIDPRACVANALHEGAGGGIGDKGTAYGPFQVHATDGRLPQFKDKSDNNATVNAWAWSDNGIRYAVRSMATGKPSARGLMGHAAVYAIVYGFEKPADKHGAYVTRSAEYDRLVALGSGWAADTAPRLLGPIAGGATATPPSDTSPAAAPYKPPGVVHSWRGVVDVFGTDVPKAREKIRAINSDLMGVFK